jgi:uncharacterized coiled-coil DUF342 family protein
MNVFNGLAGKCLCAGILSGLLSLASAPFAAAGLPETPVAEHAARLRAEGDFVRLIDDLARALIFDDTNQSARQQLIALAARPEVPSLYRIRIYQLEGLYKQRANLRARLRERTQMAPRLWLGFELFDEFPLPADAAPRGFDSDQLLAAGQAVMIPDESRLDDALDVLTNQLFAETAYYTNELTAALRANDALRDELRRQEAASQEMSGSGFSAVLTAGGNPEIGQMKDDLTAVYRQVLLLKKEVEDRNRQIDGLSEELLALSFDSGEKDRKINEKIEGMESLKAELEDMEARFRFGQTIIEEKDQQIIALENKIDELSRAMALFQASFHEDMRAQEARLVELAGIIEIYRARLKDTVDENLAKQREIIQLSGNIAVLRQAAGDREPFLSHAFSSLNRLKDEVRSMNDQINQLTQNQADPATGRHLTLKLQNLERQLETTRVFLEKIISTRKDNL